MTASPNTLCLVRNEDIQRRLSEVMLRAGLPVSFAHAPDHIATRSASPVFVDRAMREECGIEKIASLVSDRGRLICLDDSLADDELVELLQHPAVNHVISDANSVSAAELVATSTHRSDTVQFGFEKYLAADSEVHTRHVTTYHDKLATVHALAQYAREVGANRSVEAKVERTVDELLMNAIYDAPKSRGPGRIGHAIPGQQAAICKFACDGNYLAVSVEDPYGGLRKDVILDHLVRARAERGKPMDRPDGGAGLGLYFILASTTRFIANVEEGSRTEVICLFDMLAKARDTKSCAQSIHVFYRPIDHPETSG